MNRLREHIWNSQLVLVVMSTIAFLWGTIPASAKAEPITIPACTVVILPGPENTLNPHAPKRLQVQDRVKVCSMITIEGRKYNPHAPITDRKHDPRAIA